MAIILLDSCIVIDYIKGKKEIKKQVDQIQMPYFVDDLNPIKGREQPGSRPVLVLSSDTINKLTLVVSM